MTDFSDTSQRLTSYAEAFDFYMESGTMPETMTDDDPLSDLVSMAAESGLVTADSPESAEIVREAMVNVLSPAVEQMKAEQESAADEQQLIDQFESASLEEKRILWPQVKKAITSKYTDLEINFRGYLKQFSSDDPQAVLSALVSDWRQAFEERMQSRLQQIAGMLRRSFKRSLGSVTRHDFEERRKIAHIMYRHPGLSDILDKIGRDHDSDNQTTDSVLHCYIPAALAASHNSGDIDRVMVGRNIERVLPSELSMPDEVFLKRYASAELQQFSGPANDSPRKTELHRPAPRLCKGPVVLCVDTSGSMAGYPLEISFALVRQLSLLCRRQHRACYLIQFSVRASAIDLSLPRNSHNLESFLAAGFIGGTSGEEMLTKAVSILHSGKYSMADVLIISDLQFPQPSGWLSGKIRHEQSLGTKFYALQIGSSAHTYTSVLDKIWNL